MKTYIYLLFALNFFVYNFVQAQNIKALQSENDGKHPRLQWYSTNPQDQDSVRFSVYRTGLKEVNFKCISPLLGTFTKGDTLIYWIVDTTLTEKALYQYFITLPYAKDTVIRSEILYGHNMGYIPAPQIINFKATSVEGRKALKLSWKLNYNFTVNTISIFRSTKYDDGYELLSKVSGDTESYIDPVDIANEAYYYFIIIHDFFGSQPPSVRIAGIATHKEKPFAPKNVKVENENGQAKLSWKRFGNNIVGYRVYRQINNFGNFYMLSKMFYTPEREVSYIDSTLKGFENKDIKYYIVSISDGFVESNPSDTLSFYIQGDILKGAPQECDYVFDSLNRTMLIWTSQEIDNEVSGYNVYRTDSKGKKDKLNQQLIPFNVNYFVDEDNTSSSEYIYEIETVSITNTPSLTRAIAKVNRQKMPQHLILSLRKTGKGISISGTPMSGNDIKEIILYKQTNSNAPKQVTKLKPDNINYTDMAVIQGEIYNYSAIAVLNDNTKQTINAGVILRY